MGNTGGNEFEVLFFLLFVFIFFALVTSVQVILNIFGFFFVLKHMSIRFQHLAK